ncbi:basic leucine zipper transcriptional factor ATF-like 2 [Embiotoca jacksoni]|uniref:basic leucine zipper transcriptional factor ATF-like 2 n=1 Tax=Embiotoca jacksoni TaxID=100190 RepID=UPI0037038DDA
MSPLFMDTGYEANSPGSLSAGESNSNSNESERDEEGQQTQPRGKKRRQKNRDAARKSRKKQTERADELHEELQCLERSNSSLQKEIAALKKNVHLYETALERHEPHCCLTASTSSSSSSTRHPVSASADGQNSLSSNATLSASPSPSTSLSSSLGLKRTHRSPSAAAPTTATSSAGSSVDLFPASSHSPSSSPVIVPSSVSFSTHTPAPHSLFSEEPLVTSRTANVMPVCANLASNPVLSTAAQLQPGPATICDETSSVSANVFLDEFLMKQASFLAASSNMVPPSFLLGADNTVCPVNAPQLHPCEFSGKINSSSPPYALLPSPLQSPAPQALSLSPQASLEPSPTPPFALTYNQQVTPSPVSLLSLLTVPSPPDISQSTSSSFDGSFSKPLPSPPPLGDHSKDVSLSEFLEINDWILSGMSNQ